MANTKSAKKSISIYERNRTRNRHYRTTMRSSVSKFLEVLESTSNPEEARAALHHTQKVIALSVSKGVIKKQTSERKVSRLYKHFNRKFSTAGKQAD
ncbi:MAG: hypothetical protein A2Y63_05690 [Candidatus Riflebacteria bacterium RBG_13_59_9]|nr:MAG: hypothetical protein A2Y63_05690 [Candidatus Riflebacteria bacterium RBG_13_59_9]